MTVRPKGSLTVEPIYMRLGARLPRGYISRD